MENSFGVEIYRRASFPQAPQALVTIIYWWL